MFNRIDDCEFDEIVTQAHEARNRLESTDADTVALKLADALDEIERLKERLRRLELGDNCCDYS